MVRAIRLKGFSLLNLLAYLGVIIILALVLWIALWEFGILKKETTLPKEVEDIKKELDYLNNYDFKRTAENLQSTLPTPQIIEIPEIQPNEIGKPSIFE
jgi:cytoskeletal protein RodZ